MATGHWIALGIVIVALIALVVGVIYVIGKVQTPLEKIQDLQADVNDRAQFYQGEVEVLKSKVEDQNRQVQAITDQVSIEKEKFDHLTKESKQLANQVQYIRDMRGEVMQAAIDQGIDYVQHDLPRHWKKLKWITKKTIDKQKQRYSKQA